jgi:hypothetical protein
MGARDTPDLFAVFPGNWDAVILFLRECRQVITVGGGVPVAIDHGAIWATMRAMGRGDDLELYDDVLLMESVAIRELQQTYKRR